MTSGRRLALVAAGAAVDLHAPCDMQALQTDIACLGNHAAERYATGQQGSGHHSRTSRD